MKGQCKGKASEPTDHEKGNIMTACAITWWQRWGVHLTYTKSGLRKGLWKVFIEEEKKNN